MTRYSVTVTMTPHQAAEAADALHYTAVVRENGRLFSAANRVSIGLQEAGWIAVNLGTADEPEWAWQTPENREGEP